MKKNMPKKLGAAKIMVFGTFDGLHPGHLNFFKQARRLAKASYLIVSVARDTNVKKIKGRLPVQKESGRLDAVRQCPLVDKAILAGRKNYLRHILQIHPDIIALGHDQKAYVPDLKRDIKLRCLPIKIRRLKAYRRRVYKSSLINKI